MTRNLLLRPLPLALLFIFLAVAVGDVVLSRRDEPQPPPDLLRDGELSFTSWEPILDFRSPHGFSAVDELPRAELDPGGWSEPIAEGRRLEGETAGLDLSLVVGGHRTMVLQCRASEAPRGTARLEVTVNGVACGGFVLGGGRHEGRLHLPDGAVVSGQNRVELAIVGDEGAPPPGLVLEVRRLGLFFEAEVGGDPFRRREPVSVDIETGRVTVRESGTLEARFVVDDRIDALRSRYRFRAPSGRAELTVARPEGAGAGRDAVDSRSLEASDRSAGAVRFPLHGRRGEFRFRADIDLGPGPGRFDLMALRLVSEKGRRAAPDPPLR